MKAKKTANAEQTASSTPAHAKEPIQYSSELATRICDLLATGESIRTICQADGMPHETTIYGWLYRQPEFLRQYRGARIAGCERIADDLFEIVDDSSKDWVERKTASGVEVVADHEHISRSRLRFDARRWYLSKLVPKVFGDRVEVDLQADFHIPPIEEMGRIERARRVAFTFGLAERELLQMGFPELSKLLRVEDALRRLGIDLAEPFDKPVLSLPAPDVEAD